MTDLIGEINFSIPERNIENLYDIFSNLQLRIENLERRIKLLDDKIDGYDVPDWEEI